MNLQQRMAVLGKNNLPIRIVNTPDSSFSWVPFNVYRSGVGTTSTFFTDYNPNSTRPATQVTVYAGATTGNNNNDGLTPSTPVRSLSLAGLIGVAQGVAGVCIQDVDHAPFRLTRTQARSGQASLNATYPDSWAAAYFNAVSCDIVLEPYNSSAPVINMQDKAVITFSATADPNIFVANLPSASGAATQIPDPTVTDQYGFPIGLNPVYSAATPAAPWPEINAAWDIATAGAASSGPSKWTYRGASFVDTTNNKVYVRMFDNRNPGTLQIYDGGTFAGQATAVAKHINIWLKNVQFWGGMAAFKIIATTTNTTNLYSTNCAALFVGTAGSNSIFWATGGGGTIIHQNTYGRGLGNDMFAPAGADNTTQSHSQDTAILNARAWAIGVIIPGGASINGNTGHSKNRTVDIGSRFYDVSDRVEHFISLTYTWCGGVEVSNSRGPSGGVTATGFAVGFDAVSPGARMWLDNCRVVAGVNGMAQCPFEAYALGIMYVANMDVPTNSDGTGTITSYTP